MYCLKESQPHRPRFSIVVPVLNEQRWLPQTLAALDAQTYPIKATEIIFVDNGSSDNSVEILTRHPQVHILHEPRQDPYLARNRGIEAAKADYIALLDADCPPRSDWLAELAAASEQSSADILLGALMFSTTSPFMLKCYEAYYNGKLEWLIRHRRKSNLFGHAGNMVVSRKTFVRIGLFEPMPIVGDTEIIHRLFQADPDAIVQFVPNACVVHAEVDTVCELMRKLYATGRYTQNLCGVSHYQPVSLQDKVQIAIATASKLPNGFMGVPALCAVLVCGWVVYLAGRSSVMLQKTKFRISRLINIGKTP